MGALPLTVCLYVWANSRLMWEIRKWMLGVAHHLLHHLGQLNPP